MATTYRYRPDSYGALMGTKASAEAVVDRLLRFYTPTSVVDFGGAIGVFVKAFLDRGVARGVVVDGHWVDPSRLVVTPDSFVAADLTERVDLGERFDLAVSLETAEHLPPASAETFIGTLTSHADVVLFSAAFPNIPGNGHINCRYPSYWAELFGKRDYAPVDCMRSELWCDPAVRWSYTQGCFVYVNRSALSACSSLAEAARQTNNSMMDAVHPRAYEYVTFLASKPSLRQCVKSFPRALAEAIRARSVRLRNRRA